ncbi:Transposable element Tcb2 transposase [Merluccius polli]|uniref:Transposable element Tcb2 transposase n=1 Tax=Merluccius polli TaxID=89951 RepID=A0AA47N5R6_MERPO|nr:Transposable element Tcb2 transposase [Merluccius polli]
MNAIVAPKKAKRQLVGELEKSAKQMRRIRRVREERSESEEEQHEREEQSESEEEQHERGEQGESEEEQHEREEQSEERSESEEEQSESEEEQHEREEQSESEPPPRAHDISKSKTDGPTQPDLKAFPKTLQGSAMRSFRSEWYKGHCLERSAVDLIEALRQRFEEYRNEENHFELWNTVVEICGKCSIPITVRLKRVTQTTRALDDSFVKATLGQRSQVDSKDAFRRRIFLPIMDSLICEMEKRFSKSSIQIMKGIQGLNPASDVFLREDVVVLLAEAYGSNVQDLENELKQAQRLFARYKENGTNSPSSLIDLVKCLEPFKEVMCELYRLCKIAAVLPCTHLLMATSSRITRHVKARIISDWFLEHDNEFTVLKWPPQSPDLNPIEHLWDVVEREIRIMDVQPTNLQQLRDAIMSIWTKLSEECFQYLVESVPRRIKAVLKAKGGPTRY